MKISVLLSLYAKENPLYFDLSMKSIWDDQIRKPDEIVLVEDGNLTTELDIIVNNWIAKLGSILKVVKLKDNKGLAIALNEGIKHCTGEYIARMDTDDISLPERFKLQEQYILNHPDVVVLGGGMIEFDEQNGELPERIMPLSLPEIKKAICKTSPFVHPAVMLIKNILKNGFMYNPQCRRCQDLELWFRIIAAGYNVANLPNIIIKFRKSSALYAKRKKSAGIEFHIYMKGIYMIYNGFTWRYLYPIIHYLFRKLPVSWSNTIYKKFILKYWR